MSKKSILVLDDSQFERQLLARALEMRGHYVVREAKDSKECLDLLSKEDIGLILMDIMMPGDSGIETLTKIRTNYNPIELPIIMVTSKSETEDITNCLLLGANDYITKPVNFSVALSRISSHLMIAELSKKISKLDQMKAMNALITTYNHEINNPLTIAIGSMGANDLNDPKVKERISKALWRIADIVKKIEEIVQSGQVEFEAYTSSSLMVKIKK